MATYHTNNLTGNDTTGDGTAALPWKTVTKGLSVATGSDTVKVAGGQWQSVGTVTCTNRGTTMTTGGDYTASLQVGRPIAIDTVGVDGFTKEKTMFIITAITSTTITTGSQTFPTASGTYDLWALDATHYTQTATSGTFETLTAPTSPTNIVVSGGWDPTFTVQDGWTVAKAGTTGAPTSANLFNTGAINSSAAITFDRFLCAGVGFSTTTVNTSFAIDTINFVYTNLTFGGTTNMSLWNPTSGFVTFIASNANLTAAYQSTVAGPSTLYLKQWITVGNTTYVSPKYGTNNLYGNLVNGPKVRSTEIHWRTAGSAANLSTMTPFLFSTSTGDVYVDYFKFYLSGATVTPLLSNAGQLENTWKYVGDIDTVITDGTVCGIFAGPSGTIDSNTPTYASSFNINRSSGSLLDLKWCSYGQRGTSQQWPKLAMTQIYGMDTNGQVVVNQDNIPKYADSSTYVTGSNSLKMKIVPNVNNIWWNSYICGTLAKPNGTFNLTIKAKASKTVAVESVRLLYSNAELAEVGLGAITLTTSWQDFTFSINSATYPSWNLANDGLMAVFLRIISSETSISTNDYIWIDSVTIS